MSYAALYYGTKPVVSVSAAGADAWVRPADWMTLDLPAPTANRVEAIYGICNDDMNYVSVLIAVSTGTWAIDWGDGVIETGLTSNVKRDHYYDWSDADLGAAKADGMKQARIIITPTTGNITSINFQQRHTSASTSVGYSVNWLDMVVSGPSINSLTLGGATVTMFKLKRFRMNTLALTSVTQLFYNCVNLQSVSSINSSAAITNMSYMFYYCSTLTAIPTLPSVSAVTTMAGMFQACSCLKSIPAWVGSVSLVTNMGNMFSGCSSLVGIPAFPGSTGAVTTMSSMFSGCMRLETIPAFPVSTALVNNMSAMFNGCQVLRTIPAFPSGVNAVTTMASMFINCFSLLTIPAFTGSIVLVTTMQNMFSGCASLQSIPAFPGTNPVLANLQSMFQGCTTLETIPAFPSTTTAVTNVIAMFAYSYRMGSVPIMDLSGVTSAANAVSFMTPAVPIKQGRANGMRFSVSYEGCYMSRTSLIDLFNGLGTASGAPGTQVINVKLNPGTAALTAGDKQIATDKGWAVTTA